MQLNTDSIKTEKVSTKKLQLTQTEEFKLPAKRHKTGLRLGTFRSQSKNIILSPKSLEIKLKAGEYFIKNLDEAFCEIEATYFGNVFKDHLKKSIVILDKMREIGEPKYKFQMTPVSLDLPNLGIKPVFL